MWTAINLIKITQSVNDYGDLVDSVVRRQVFAEELSVGMTETYQAMAVGYNPEVKFRLENWMDYEGEEIVEFQPFARSDTRLLRVLRTYRDGERLELVCYEGIDQPVVLPEPEPTPTPTPEPTPEPEEPDADTEVTNEDQNQGGEG